MKRIFIILLVLGLLTACSNNKPKNEEVVVTDDPVLRTTVEDLFAAELNLIVPDEYLDASSRVSNAMLRATEVNVLSALNDSAKVVIKYPDVASALLEGTKTLSDNPTTDEWDAFFINLAQQIENNEVKFIEETFDVELVNSNNEINLVLTDELINALSGGLYLIEGGE